MILVGDFSEELRRDLAQRTGTEVAISQPGAVCETTLEELTSVVSAHPDRDIVIMGGPEGLRVLVVDSIPEA